MEYRLIVRDAWSTTVSTKQLWWLGLVSAAQVAVYAVVVSAVVLPMSMMPQLAASVDMSGVGAGTRFVMSREQVFLGVGQWLTEHVVAISLVGLSVFVVWLVLSVFDVAAQTGIVTQVDAVADGRVPSVAGGLRDGFRLWWRAVALLALSALPGLVYLLVMALVVFFTISLPLFLRHPPDAGAALISNLVLTPLSALVSLVAVPLGVLVQLAMRFAVVDDVEWRPSFGAAWRLTRANIAEIIITYAVLLLVTLVAVMAFVAIVAVAIGGLSVGAVFVVRTGGNAAAGRWALLGLAGVLFLAFQTVMFVWQSAVWTLVWRDRTGRGEGTIARESEREISRGATVSTTEGSL